MTTQSHNATHRLACFAYGAVVYVAFLGVFTYCIGFVDGFIVPKQIDTGIPGPRLESIVINALLLSLFVIQHTIMARPWFKKAWTKLIPVAIERSTFVLAATCVLVLVFWQWRPMPVVVWSVTAEPARIPLFAVSALGWLVVLYATFCIDHFDLFGLRQVFLHLRGAEYHHPGFATPLLYRLVRNPLMLGFIIAFWAAPTMSQGHLLFAALVTGYVFVGVWFEERDLMAILGDDYRAYRARTPMLLPLPRPKVATMPA